MNLLKKLNDKTAVIAIVGLGYVGLPLKLVEQLENRMKEVVEEKQCVS